MNWIESLRNKLAQATVRKSESSSLDLVAYKAKIQLIKDYLLSERYQEAEVLIRELLITDMYRAEVWELLGACVEDKNLADAETYYFRAIELDPARTNSYLGLGVIRRHLNQPIEALRFFEKAKNLNPKNVIVLTNIAEILRSLKRYKDALVVYQQAELLQPADAQLFHGKGICFREINQFIDSEMAFKKALELAPSYEDTYYELGLMYQDTKNYSKAKAIFTHLITTNAKNPEGYILLAGLQFTEGNYIDAYATQKLGLEVGEYDSADAHRQMMHICASFYNKEEEVKYHLNKLEQLAPNSSHLNDAVQFLREQKFAEAFNILEIFKQEEPENTIPEVNKALALLLLGFYKEGWIAYEVRKFEKLMKDSILNTSRLIPLPFWDGTPIPDKTLVVVTEQGVGDSIHFVRYLPLLKAHVNKVILTCNPNVERLFSCIPGITVATSIEDVINADYQILTMSLPMIFKTELATIPNAVPYLWAESELSRVWSERFKPWKTRLKVGLVWAGGAVFKGDLNRSTKLSQFAPIFDVKNVVFFSLQLGPQSAQIADKPAHAELIDFTQHISNFADTAALVSQLDLVISVDTSVAHLAGALAIPVWVLLPFFPDHRWFLEREDSPWYPTARLFRQARNRNWDEVFIKMAETLTKVAIADIENRNQALLPPPRDLITEAENYLSQGRIAYAEYDYENAKLAFERAIVLKPDSVNAWYNLGLINQLLDKAAIARICYKRALVLDPKDAGAYHNLACIAADYKNDKEALQYFQQSWQLDHNNPEVAYNFSSLLRQIFDIQKGLQIQKVGLDIAPDHRLGWINYALLLAESGDDVASKAAMQHAFLLPLHESDALIAEEAELLFSLGELDYSLEKAKLAAKLNPENIKAQVGQGFIYLKQGKLLEGWKLMESRLKVARESQQMYTADIWDGKEMPTSTLLVHAEQGLGDLIQMMRYIPMLRKMFGNIVIHIPRPLVVLAKMIIGAEDLKVSWDEIPKHDIRIPAMSIPLRFNTTLDTIPDTVPYFNITSDYMVKWSAFVGDRNTKKRIGLAWTGNQRLASNRRRSLPVELLSSLTSFRKVEWWSLQKDHQDILPASVNLINKMHLSANLADTAALIMQLDLVITVDTAIAHLAGALGKQVWILLAYNSDYRWLLDTKNSPWYPTAQLFRQDKRYRWEPVIEEVVAALEDWMRR